MVDEVLDHHQPLRQAREVRVRRVGAAEAADWARDCRAPQHQFVVSLQRAGKCPYLHNYEAEVQERQGRILQESVV